MDTLQQLAVALGLAGLAGINLYLTVFVTGLAIQQHWIQLADRYHDLAILGEPVIVIIAGVLYALEFFADKVPWVDSLWDSVHTLIRPIGGAMLSIKALGQPDPVFDVLIGLAFGSVSLLTHTAKAGTRLLVNGSPEPFSNIAVSLTEDVAVMSGLVLLNTHPLISLVMWLTIIAAIIYFAPKIFRSVRTKVWLAWRKLNARAENPDAPLPTYLPPEHDQLFHQLNLLGETLAWAVPCFTGGGKLPNHANGYLVGTVEDGGQLYFLGRCGMSKIAQAIDITDYKVAHETKFLHEKLTLYPLDRRPKYVFNFDRPRAVMVRQVAALLASRLGSAATKAEVVSSAPLLPA